MSTCLFQLSPLDEHASLILDMLAGILDTRMRGLQRGQGHAHGAGNADGVRPP